MVAIDGTSLDVPDHPATRTRLGKGSNQYTAASGYPQIRLVALVACGTRTMIDAVFGPTAAVRPPRARRARSLRTGMIVLLDRDFSAQRLAGDGRRHRRGAAGPVSASRKPPVLRRFPDGSFLSRIGALQVRIIDCEITITTSAGRHTGIYRLATTLLDSRASRIRPGQALPRTVGCDVRSHDVSGHVVWRFRC